MKFECDSCHAQYMIADEKLGTRGVKVKCKRCQHVIIVRPPPSADAGEAISPADEPTAVEAAPEAPSDELGFSDDDFDGFGDGFDGSEAGNTAENAFGGDTEVGADLPPEADDGLPDGLDLGDDEDEMPGNFDATQVTPSPLLADDGADGDEADEDEDEEEEEPPAPDEDELAASSDDEDVGEDDDAFAPPPMDEAPAQQSDDAFADPFADEGGLAAAAGDADDDDEEEPPAPFDEPAADFGSFGSDEPPAPSAEDEVASGGFNFGDDDGEEDEPLAPPPSSGAGDLGDLAGFGATAEGPAFQNDTEMAPPGALGGELGGLDDVPAPPEPPAAPTMGAADEAPAMPEASGDALGDEIAGAFEGLFDGAGEGGGLFGEGGGGSFGEAPSPAEPNSRGPTQVVDINQMDQLRADSMPTQMGGGGLDDLRSDIDSSLGAEFGGVPVGSGVPPEEPEWHVAIDEEEIGPIKLSEVREHIEAGRLDRESLAWKAGMDDWEAVEDIPALNALFDKVPMPDIGGAGAVAGAFDVGAPIDDMAPSPFDGGAEPSDPFASAPDLGGQDANWQPHGLTEVYQAANLAEAAGGIGKDEPAAAAPSVGFDEPMDDGDDDGWQPGAGNALASLVNDEISRIESGGMDEPSLPPAADDSLSIDSPLSLGGNSGLGSLDLPSDSGAPVDDLGSLPPAPAVPPVTDPGGGLGGMGGLPPQQGMGGMGPMPVAPYQQPASPLKNPVVLAAGGLGALVVLVLLVLVVVLVVKDDKEPTVAAAPPVAAVPGAPAAPGAVAPAAGAPGAPGTPGAAPAAAAPGAPDPAAAAAAAAAATPPPAEEPAAAEPTKVAAASTPKPKPKPKPSGRRTSKPASSKPPPPPPPPTRSKRDCDPVLDFDCPEGGARSGGGSRKKTLSPSDVLTVVRKNLGSVNKCGKKHGVKGTVKMEWRILKSGNTTAVKVMTSKYAGTPVGSCMTRAIKRWKFPGYSGKPPPPVKFPFKLK
jgi:predicted Zn finger-like uncharacterized protein